MVLKVNSLQTENKNRLSTFAFMVFVILLIQAGAALWCGLPGQVTIDAIIQMYEGQSHQTISFHPPLMSMMLGVLERLGNAPVAFVLISQTLLTCCTWLVLTSENRQPIWRYMLAAVFLLNPVILIYVGILWKDVLFAHVNVLLFLLLASWRAKALHIGVARVALLIILLTASVGFRQQGILFAFVAAIWAAQLITTSRVKMALVALALIATPVILNQQLTNFVQKPKGGPVEGSAIGLDKLMYYDLVGIVANGGELPAGTAKAFVDEIHQQIPLYTPSRVDPLNEASIPYWWNQPLATNIQLWRTSIMRNPGAYLKHRLHVSEAIVGMSDMRQCTVVDSGVNGPLTYPSVDQELTALLGLHPGPNHSTAAIIQFAWANEDGPLFRHWVYALVLIGVCVVLVRRRAYILLSLAICSLILLASYTVLGIACDFRYAYTLTVTTSLLAAWAVLARPNAMAQKS